MNFNFFRKISGCIFEELLAFTTGAEKVPPAGFSSEIQIQFFQVEKGTRRLPFVSTVNKCPDHWSSTRK